MPTLLDDFEPVQEIPAGTLEADFEPVGPSPSGEKPIDMSWEARRKSQIEFMRIQAGLPADPNVDLRNLTVFVPPGTEPPFFPSGEIGPSPTWTGLQTRHPVLRPTKLPFEAEEERGAAPPPQGIGEALATIPRSVIATAIKPEMVPLYLTGVAEERLAASGIQALAKAAPYIPRAVSTAFATQMVPEAATEIESVAQPGLTVPERIARAGQAGVTTAFAMGAGVHAGKPVDFVRNYVEGLRPAVLDMDDVMHPGQKGMTHNDIISEVGLKAEDVNRRTFVDAKGREVSRQLLAQLIPTERLTEGHSTDLNAAQEQIDASKEQEATAVHGDVRAQPVPGEREVPAEEGSGRVLTPAQAQGTQVLLRQGLAENQKRGLASDVVVLEDFGRGDPHHLQIAAGTPPEVDAQGNFVRPGKILLSKAAFDKWLKDIPEKRRPEAIASLLTEEGIHATVTPKEALEFLSSLSSFERTLGEKLYRGGRTVQQMQAIGAWSDTQIGHELLRQRMQRILRMTPTEIADAVRTRKWTARGLELLMRLVGRLREMFGTKAAGAGKAVTDKLLDRYQRNLQTALDEAYGFGEAPSEPGEEPAPGEVEAPFAVRRGGETTPDELDQMDNAEAAKYFADIRGAGIPPQHDAVLAGMKLGREDVPRLEELRDKAGQEMTRAFVSGDKDAQLAAFGKNIWYSGAIEGAKREGPNYETAIAKGAPAAVRRGKVKEEPQAELFLPPLAKGETVERGVELKAAEEPEGETRLKMTPVDIDWAQPGKEGAYRPIMDAEIKQPEELGKTLTRDARIGGSQLPMSQSRRLVVLMDKQDGKVYMVSVHPDSRRGAMVVDPKRPDKRNVQFPTILDRYKPLYSVLRETPVKNFHQEFRDFDDFQARFGEEAGQRSHESIGGFGGVQESTRPELYTEPESLQEMLEKGVEFVAETEEPRTDIVTDQELRSFHDIFGGETPPTKHDFDRAMLKAASSANRQAVNAVYKAFVKEAEANPKASPEENLESALSKLYEDLSKADTRSAFISAAQNRLSPAVAEEVPKGGAPVTEPKGFRRSVLWQPRAIPEGRAGVALPPRPEPPRTLSPEAQAAVAERARGAYPPRLPSTIYSQLAERTLPEVAYQRGRDVAALTHPQLEQMRRVMRGESAAQEGARRAGDLDLQSPAAVNRNARVISDELENLGRDAADILRRGAIAQRVSARLDSVDDIANNVARQIEEGIRLKSTHDPGGVRRYLKADWRRGNKDILAAANAVVESGFDFAKLADFKDKIRVGRAIAEQALEQGNLRKRREARAWLRALDDADRELDYAAQNWNSPELQATARRAQRELQEAYRRETAAGIQMTEDPNYVPHRYVMLYRWGILGKRYKLPQTFETYYDALQAGPYLPITRDIASEVSHRVRQGITQIESEKWKMAMQTIFYNGKPLAIEPLFEKGRWRSPDIDYATVGGEGGMKPLAVQADFAGLFERLTGRSIVQDWAVPRAVLHLEQKLKHTLLLGDFFHMARVMYYGLSIMRKNFGFRGGWSALDYKESDINEAVRRGLIRQADADWANQRIDFTTQGGPAQSVTRRQLLERFYGEHGLNVGKIQDALYKDLVTQLTPRSWRATRAVMPFVDATIGRYNRFLFDNLTRGVMAESAIREFERQHAARPDIAPDRLMADIAKDVNTYFGNLGRQGFLKSRSEQDIARLFLLAPQWVEGLARKEMTAYSRWTGLSQALGRRGLTYAGTTGRGIATGLTTLFFLTQALNLITRRQPTWKNPEKGHMWDAYIPGWGAEGRGFWFSPLAIYNELTHDVYRLVHSKPHFMRAFAQIAQNKESPLVRAALVGLTGQGPTGEIQTTGMGTLGKMAEQVAPLPISFYKMFQAGGHALAPSLVRAPDPTAVQRQLIASGGIKIEPEETPGQRVAALARDFIKAEGLEKETGWQQVMNDEASYSKLRASLRLGDLSQAKKIYTRLLKGRTEQEIVKSMKRWAQGGFTGNKKHERMFMNSLDDEQLEEYSRALDQKMELYDKFLDFYQNLSD